MLDPRSLAYQPPKQKKKLISFSKLVRFVRLHKKLLVISAIVLSGAALSGVLVINSKQQPPEESPNEIYQKEQERMNRQAWQEQQDLIGTVNAQVALPQGEEPVLATVSDRNSLQEQEFFKEAQNGDRILLYPKNEKAFLYRPSTGQVIAEAPLIYEPDKSKTATVAAEASSSAEVEVTPTIIPHGKVLYRQE